MPLSTPARTLLQRLRPWLSKAVHVRWTQHRSFYQREADALLMALSSYQGRMPPDLALRLEGFLGSLHREWFPRTWRKSPTYAEVVRDFRWWLDIAERWSEPPRRRTQDHDPRQAPGGAAVEATRAAAQHPRPAAELHPDAVPQSVAAVPEGQPSRPASGTELRRNAAASPKRWPSGGASPRTRSVRSPTAAGRRWPGRARVPVRRAAPAAAPRSTPVEIRVHLAAEHQEQRRRGTSRAAG